MIALAIVVASSGVASAQDACPSAVSSETVIETEAIDLVWSATNVDFDLVTEGTDQLLAYYNATRNLVVAHRKTETAQAFYGTVWNFKQLDTMLGWDNHNDIVAGISRDGHFHVIGNMHADRIVYYKTRHPREIRSLERVEVMVDPRLEARMTYPEFFTAADGTLIFRFRFGGSGNGNEVYYRYDDRTGKWAAIHSSVFSDGEGKRNAYFGPTVRGPDGKFHMAWVWRSQGGSTMNSMVSYARTSDFQTWEDAFGNPLTLPVLYANTPVAAPVPDEEGMVNGHQKVGFDPKGRPLVTYVRYDENRIAQAFLARFEGDGWKQYQITNLDRVTHITNRRGNQTPSSVSMRFSPRANDDGTVSVDLELFDKPATIDLDGKTLAPLRTCDRQDFPIVVAKWRKHETPGLGFRWKESGGNPADKDRRVIMTWHSLPGNRDRAFEDITAPTTLRVHVLSKASTD